MSYLRRFGLAISLTVMLAGTAIAGETNGPPSPNPGAPRTTSQFITNEPSEPSSNAAGEMQTIVVEAALDAIESLLTLF